MATMKKLAMAASLMSVITVTSLAQGADVVQQRMDAMKDMSAISKELSNIARGRADFDLNLVTSSAQRLADLSDDSLLAMFEEGTAGGDSDAKPEIWSQWDDFTRIAGELNQASIALSAISGEDEFAAAFKAVSDTCSSCHKSYRARR